MILFSKFFTFNLGYNKIVSVVYLRNFTLDNVNLLVITHLMTDQTLRLVRNDLCFINVATKEIVKRHSPLFRILEFRRVKDDTIIIREDATGLSDRQQTNIYCIDDEFVYRWFAGVTFENDIYPNEIIWDKELNDNGSSWDDFTSDHHNSLVCSSQKGFTVAINYDSGQITNSIFTK